MGRTSKTFRPTISPSSSQAFIRFHNLGFRYSGAVEPLFRDLSVHFAVGWTGVIGSNGTGKSTLLKLACRLLEPDEGQIQSHPFTIYCPQRTDDPPEELEEFMAAHDRSANIIRDKMKIQYDWPYRWNTLSHGERKRAQVAVAIWREPDVLAIDEPFNHLDGEARAILAEALFSFGGVGLLVSHDRDILDRLCYQSLFLEPPEAIIRPGGYTKAREAVETERLAMEKRHLQEKRAHKKIHKEMVRRKEMAQQAKSRVSKKGLAKNDHDGRSKRDLARLSGKDAVGGTLKRQMESRLQKSSQNLRDTAAKKQYSLGIWFPESLSRRDYLFSFPAGTMPLSETKTLHYPQVLMRPDDRIAITGPNGVGKSTLIRFIVENLSLPSENVTYIPQEIDRSLSRQLLKEARELPNDRLGYLMTVISCLGSRPQRLLSSDSPSPGEIRKLLLALGMSRKPHLIILDEPTNHMDLPSIRCLEEALSGCPCGLMLISHDKGFIKALAHTRWRITNDGSNEAQSYKLEIERE